MTKACCKISMLCYTINMEIEIIKFFQSAKSPFLDVVMWLFSSLASVYFVIFLFLFLYFFMSKKLSIFFVCCTIFNVGLNYLVKIIINRPRPYEVSEEIVNVTNSLGKSFPSGHIVCATTIIVLFLWFFLSKQKSKIVKIFAVFGSVIYLTLVAISRMYFGQHYPTDLLAGLTLGLVLTVIEILIMKCIKKKRKKISQTP